MTRGQVEIPLSGRIEDFSSSILLHADDVHAINDVIKVINLDVNFRIKVTRHFLSDLESWFEKVENDGTCGRFSTPNHLQRMGT